MCIRDRAIAFQTTEPIKAPDRAAMDKLRRALWARAEGLGTVSYTHLRAHETVLDSVCRLLLEKKIKTTAIQGVTLST